MNRHNGLGEAWTRERETREPSACSQLQPPEDEST